ncbi:MAG: ECF transporter S component [Dehalococcoidales bacterium]
MINRIAVSKLQPFPVILKYTEIRSYIFIGAFTLLSVAVPWAFHQFHLAGPTFLPMHIFIFAAGLLFGWRVGLIVGFLTPLASYAVSGMPGLPVLPQIVVELSAYGLVAGMLRERLNLRVMWSLLGAMIAGRLALFLAVLVIYLIAGETYSPLGLAANPFLAVWSVIKQGGPGIALQLALIPGAIWLVGKLAVKTPGSS